MRCSSSTFVYAPICIHFWWRNLELADSSDGPGSTPKSGAAALIWLFVIPLSTISSTTHGLYYLRDIPTSSNIWRSPLSRHIKDILLCMHPLDWSHSLVRGCCEHSFAASPISCSSVAYIDDVNSSLGHVGSSYPFFWESGKIHLSRLKRNKNRT